MRLTKKQALGLTLALWDWLFHHPTKEKLDWPEWKRNGGIYPGVDSECFCCEYDQYRATENMRKYAKIEYSICQYCPLYKELSGCGRSPQESIFIRWDNAMTPKTKKKYAGLIAEAAASKYKELL